MRRPVLAGGAIALAAALTAAGPPASAQGVNQLPAVTDGQITASISDIELRVDDIDLRVEDVESTSTEGSQTVVSLKSDVLFAFGKATLPPAAAERIGQLVADVPRRGRLQVFGHTDAIGSTAANRRLSLARARAVAGAVRRSRADLRLDVRGFGETRPVAPNRTGGKDDPAGRAKNRRVELRYTS